MSMCLLFIQFLWARANIHTVLMDKKNHVYCIHGNNGLENSYQPIPRIALGICASILCTNLGN